MENKNNLLEPENAIVAPSISSEQLETQGLVILNQPVEIEPGLTLIATGPSPDQLDIVTPFNVNAADTTNANELWPGGSQGLNLTGNGVTVGVWEPGGIVRDTHQEFGSRVTNVDSGSFIDHATHVAGTIGASGVQSAARGMANQVEILSYDSTNDLTEMDAAASQANPLLLSNHSYGSFAGWTNRIDWGIGPVDTWYDNRSIYSTEGPRFGKYNSDARDLDQVLYENPNLLSVWAAGNDRNDTFTNIRGTNEYVTYLSNVSSPAWYLVSTSNYSAPEGDGNGGTGYDSLPFDQVAKNNLVVGAINDITADPYNNSDVTMSSFSDWGPTDDGRMKPDVVGNGVFVNSPTASSNSSYGNISGTSMAAPNVTGTTALLYEHYDDLFSATPRSATMKGLLIHTAFDAGNVGPDYTYGWGVVDGAAAAGFLTDVNTTNGSSQLIEGSYTGSTQTISITVNPGEDLKATLVWTDLPGTPHGNGLDETTPVLVNDLDLSITGPNGTTYYPWTLNPANPSAPAVKNKANNLDNVEQVLIDATATQSGTYTINIEGDSFNQNYSLLISGAGNLQSDSTIGETGSISNLTHTARTINLSRSYQNPVVFAQPLSFNGSAPAAVRLSNITNNSFTIQVQEPNNEDGTHAAENLSFIVMEAGTWELADGTKLQVGTTDSNQLVSQGWETVNFDAGFNNNPVVMSQVQTFNGSDFVRTRQRNIGANGFQVGMEEEEANKNSGHTNETIGYFAMSGGSGNWNGLNYTAGYTGDNVTDAWRTQSLSGFSQTPQILASLASYDGADPAGIRYRNLNSNQVQFKVEEDTSADAEMAHTTENVSFLAIEGTGLLTGSPVNTGTAMGETGTISNLTHTARTINLSRSYQNPVVFAQPLSFNGSAPAAVRLSNITNNSFTIQVQEPNNEDGTHAAENLSYIVMEAGSWELADGTKLQVGTTDSNQLVAQGWETVNFNAGFNNNPVVMSQIQTFNGTDFVRTRQDNISTNGFQVGMEEEEANKNTGHANETIGYMAMSGGSGNWSGLNYTAGYSGDRITDNWGTVNFGAGFTQTPQILASLASYDGADPAGIRRRNLNNNQVQFKVEEDTSADAEMLHTTENVSFLAIEGSGILEAVSIDSLAPMAAAGAIVSGSETFTGSPEADTFILGDATEPYYDNMGIQDYALILNFDSSEDMIQLHGSASDYQLGAAPSEVPQGTGIFLNNNELVGVVADASDLSLDDSYFSFV